MALLRVREQLEYLDRFGGVLAERSHVAALGRDLRATRDARQQLLAEEREAARLQDVLRHELNEIERAELRPDEEEELVAQRFRLEHIERLRQAAQAAYEALSGTEGDALDRPGAVERLGEAAAALSDGARFDQALQAEADSLHAALAQAEDAARVVRDYVDGLEADPEALERTAERLFRIAELKRKYGETIADVLAYASQAGARLDELEHRADRADALLATEQRLLDELGAAAGGLSEHRAQAAGELSAAVERELADLRLAGARFCVSVEHVADQDGVPVADRRLAFDATGVDRIEFKIDTAGQDEPRPIARIASGGELARIALALKTILARADTRPTLIFDEIDMGVGGRTAPVVGEKLWAVARAGHQVLCVTHMAQVAAFADAHFAVSRTDGATAIAALDGPARVDELAAMLAGATSESARKSAREVLARARGARNASA
jgi:DNA repair protein RecN (Recombination protein N)